MKRTLYFVMALALVLGFTQCKKEQPLEPTNDGNGVRITLNVEKGGNNGTRVDVDPPHVDFEEGDQILVGYNGAYVGTLTHNGEHFAGSIDATVTGSQKLYFYFVGNKNKTGASISVGAESYTVDISNQTTELPVLSFSASIEDFTGAGSYSASLHNQCALVKFPLANAAGSVLVGGMYKEATISFASPGITKTGTPGQIRLFSKTDTEKWAILLPQDLVDDAAVTIGNQSGLTVDVPAIMAGDYIIDIAAIANTSSVIDLSKLTGNYTAKDGDILINTLAGNYKISIADGATVTLNGATISYTGNNNDWAGLTLIGDGTLVLADGSTNTVAGGLDGEDYSNYPGIFVPEGSTLTINGNDGVLNARIGNVVNDQGSPAGIGARWGANCGNIVINGGVINATGGCKGAGIGGCGRRGCGYITINGGTVTATGGEYAAGIGLGGTTNSKYIDCGTCGDITINGGEVTATGGENGAGIGTGYAEGTGNARATKNCGNITISGGNVTATGGEGAAGIGNGEANSLSSITCGNILINGGTVNATGGESAAGIGTGYADTASDPNSCGTITITDGVTRVTATRGTGGLHMSIGLGWHASSCGTVTIGGTVYWDGSAYQNGGDTYLTQSTLTYQP